ncbi:MAG: histidine kinase dimerization/phosphoacceptor domain -containing protein [Ignavibacteriaceae bacterium]|nr:histidine kinase dimerization/phosphoacceptor domain -containing protein [Ignavibacteriaceae bacterium]
MDKKHIIFFQTDSFLNDEEFYGLIFQNLKNYGIILLDPDGYIISWNTGAELIEGLKKDEALHNHFSILYTEEDIKNNKPNNNLRQAIVNGLYEENSLWFRKDGTKFWANVSLAALINPKGELKGFSMLMKEITKSDSATDKLKYTDELLNSIKKERTSELIKINKIVQAEINSRKGGEKENNPEVEKIETSLKEKEVLLKEIHHRVKNNLQIISSLLNLQSGYIKDKDSIEIFKESQNRVRSMALIHEKLYQSKDMSQIDFSGYVSELVSNLFGSYSLNSALVTLHQNINNLFLEIDLAINLGLIINELVSNAFKHAFPGGSKGNLYISIKKDKQMYELVIQDDGVGFLPEIDFRKTESLGLQLVISLVEQIGGKIFLFSEDGTKFVINFSV